MNARVHEFPANVIVKQRTPIIDRKAPIVLPLIRPKPVARSCANSGLLLDRTQCGLEVYHCQLHGTCSHQERAGVKWCETCRDFAPLQPRPPIRIDEKTYWPELGGKRFNSSIIEHRMPAQPGGMASEYVYAYRSKWGDADVSIARLDKDFQPIPGELPVQLDLNHAQAETGREDPRLFRHKGKLHLWYIGWNGRQSKWNQANVCFARLNGQTLQVEDKFCPEVPNRQPWEKNHSYFELAGELYAIYSIVPHRVLKILCNQVTNEWTTRTTSKWQHGHLRGGASPVMHNGEFYHFFHGMYDSTPISQRLYSVGVATFEPRPPFRITRMTHQPIDVATKTPFRGGASVIFPCGAMLVDGNWVVSMGVHDDWSELRFYDSKWIDEQLEAV